MRLLLMIPAKNEETSIGGVISDFTLELERLGMHFSVQVVDDHSTDHTSQVAERLGAKVFSLVDGKGLAAAFRTEREKALETDADIFVHADADGQHRPEFLESFISKLFDGNDLVLGNRLYKQPDSMSQSRYEMNRMLSRTVSTIAGVNIADSQTGYRAMTRRALVVSTIISSYTYTQEQIIRVARAGFPITEIPIIAAQRISGKSRLMRSGLFYLSKVFGDLDRVVEEIVPDISE